MLMCGSAFVSGVLVVLLVEALLVMVIVLRSVERRRPASVHASSSVSVQIPENSLSFNLQGAVWVAALPGGDVSKMFVKGSSSKEKSNRDKGPKEVKNGSDKSSKDSKSRRESAKDGIQIVPSSRMARLQGRILYLASTKGSKEEKILLEGCDVFAVSGASGPSRKWAKKFPIKLHHETRDVFGGCKDCLLYLDTGWEKEAWCEVLRAAARWENNPDDWYFQLKKEFKQYSLRLQGHFPLLRRLTSISKSYAGDEKVKVVKGESSTARKKLWKKLTRRSIKGNRESKSIDSREDSKRGAGDDGSATEEGSSRGGSTVSARDVGTNSMGTNSTTSEEAPTVDAVREAPLVADLESANGPHTATEKDNLEMLYSGAPGDQTLACVNMLFGRLFFDLYHSTEMVGRLQALVQRQLSKVRTPSYVGPINCTHLDLGNAPPVVRKSSLLHVDADGNWGLEAEIEYCGGAVLTIETRIDVRDSSAREKVADQGLAPGLAGAVTADLVSKGLETLGNEFNISVEEGTSLNEHRYASGTSSSSRAEEGSRKGWMQSSLTNVKAMMSRVAEQVSQVPLALTIKVVSLKGTLQLRIKPPPTDRVWFGFTEMPALNLSPEPCIGDHKINSGPLGAFIVNQIKVLLRDTMVLPQCEDLSISWMASEKKDWLERKAVPLSWNPESISDQNNHIERVQSKNNVSVDRQRLDLPVVGHTKSLSGKPKSL